jgi:glycosyltransferase involved in cell wall biosynthesis
VTPISGYIVLIPAYQPDSRFPALAAELLSRNLPLLVVDDGSGEPYREIFSEIHALGVPVVVHEKNSGQGASIKTGIREVMARYPDAGGVVTADCDRQHSAEDIEAVLKLAEKTPGTLILGSRDLKNGVPFRSALGNTITRHVFHLFTGVFISDTQSGLRGLPACLFPQLLGMRGERFEFNTNMLVHLKEFGVPLVEHPIQTIYFSENAGSHYRTFADSWRIFKLFFQR